ncbi:hypothetical protein PR048_021222 [Dryococelus australis]|uniref:Uncharacterized protein n=1 Tax=Dryococelus australis TaxID=614101 RepID=A0ABQ9GXN5_9NEOP|nr:hypothetical protein PR048_021222 [Dryococelus australis]
MPLGFLGVLPFSPALAFGASPYLPHFTIIVSQGLDVTSHPNLSNHSLLLGWNEKVGETRAPRENPPTSGIVRYDSHLRKSGVIRPGFESGSPWWKASSLTTQSPWPLRRIVYPWDRKNFDVIRRTEYFAAMPRMWLEPSPIRPPRYNRAHSARHRFNEVAEGILGYLIPQEQQQVLQLA